MFSTFCPVPSPNGPDFFETVTWSWVCYRETDFSCLLSWTFFSFFDRPVMDSSVSVCYCQKLYHGKGCSCIPYTSLVNVWSVAHVFQTGDLMDHHAQIWKFRALSTSRKKPKIIRKTIHRKKRIAQENLIQVVLGRLGDSWGGLGMPRGSCPPSRMPQAV